MNITIRIATDKFVEASKSSIGIAIGNTFLLLCTIIGYCQGTVYGERVIYCLFSIILILSFHAFYGWKSNGLNTIVFLWSLVIPIFEFLQLGIATSGYEMQYGISKGILMEMIIMSTPYLYNLMRIAMPLFLLNVIYRNYKLSKLTG